MTKKKGDIISTLLRTISKDLQASRSSKINKKPRTSKKEQRKAWATTVRNIMVADEEAQIPPRHPVNYEGVKAWIAAQEEYEREHSKPAPVTDAQRKALEQLTRLTEAPPPEPKLGNADYVSLLKVFRDAHPGGQMDYSEEQVMTLDGTPRWIIKCGINESPSSFPLGEKAISFARKKDAKKYAAKCTIEWLIEEKLMPDDGSVTFPKPKPKPPPQPPPPDTSAGGVSLLDNEAGLTATQRVPALCARLNIQAPQYKLVQDPQTPSIFSGWAEFAGGMDMPTQFGNVSNIYTRKAAKEEIAALVLEQLSKVEAQREEQADKLLQSLQKDFSY